MYRTDFWTLWEKVGCFGRTALKHVYYLWWGRSPAQVGCMRQVLGPGALGRPRGIGWRGRWEGGSGWGLHVYPRLIHVNVWQKPLQYCKVISLQLIKINEKKISLSLNLSVYQSSLTLTLCLFYSLKSWDSLNLENATFSWKQSGKKLKGVTFLKTQSEKAWKNSNINLERF